MVKLGSFCAFLTDSGDVPDLFIFHAISSSSNAAV